jgi:GntR family transcriptional regulator
VSSGLQARVSIRPDYPEPLWVQAVNLINGEIRNGALAPGARLPPERELCQQLGISRVTLRKALTKLVDDGVLTASHGRGWYVASPAERGREWPNSLESFTETAARMGLVATSRVLRADVRAATLDEAEELLVAPGAPLFYLERVRLLSALPIAVDTSMVPLGLAPDIATADFARESLYQRLEAAGLTIARADTTIEAREADAATALHLDVELGRPLLVMHQLVVDASDRPVFTSDIRYSGERYRLRTLFARSGIRSRSR